MSARSLLTPFLVAVLNQAVLAQDAESDAPRPPDRTELRAPKVFVPMDPDARRPVIEARINGKGPFRFILDTGASGSVLNDDLTQELGLPVIGKTRIGDPSNPEALEVDRVRIDTLTIGDAVLSGVSAVSWKPPAVMRQHGGDVRGVLGLSVLSDCLVTFDYANDRLILELGELPPADGASILAYQSNEEELPTIEISVGGRTLNAHIDSGSPSEFTLPDTMRNSLKLRGEPIVVGRGRTVNSEFEVRKATPDGDVKLGEHVFEQPELTFISLLDGPGVANLGSSLLRQFTVTFDQKNGRARFADRQAGTQSALPSCAGTGRRDR